MRRKITINPYDPKSINKAIATLNAYKRSFKRKEETFIRRLGEIGLSVAKTVFENAEYDGTSDVVVRGSQEGGRYTITAAGEKVGFIEFGTGVRNPEWDGFGVEYVPPKHGTYGKGRGANPGFWYYYPYEGAKKAVRSTGNPPAQAMLSARDEMIARVAEIAREVFG